MMKFVTAGLALAGSLFVAVPTLAQDERQIDSFEHNKGEQELAQLLEGRVAGEPQRCFFEGRNPRLKIVEGTALVFGRGRTIWVNRTLRPSDINDDDRLIVRKFVGSRTCRNDIVTTENRFNGFSTGTLFLTDFVPYRLPES